MVEVLNRQLDDAEFSRLDASPTLGKKTTRLNQPDEFNKRPRLLLTEVGDKALLIRARLTTLVYGAIGASLIAALAAIVSLMQISQR
ncbi:unnamed protein product [marine sediment metagenome]|uniref:Uncharacterized protein n=1 Tax=marine sediment metagenome TaxID=412755 RepID=X0YE95_9ZZZZ